ncbi:hypothetical protein AVT69_gp202 [Pseudomonas phage PhiPA3]|uniref:Uncharacterized protein 204 n=1 Tax=Pseudomonas phage PhiPA3 TaxID=998086 RepID=F8SJ47_BPPA3|nr:hypothetical protein AVT69_gp202 [Pseudomonas phage PhiPA3]AEH03627.1 hypothetical protein [Pseudomonas phage PhiPA3]
MKWSFINEPFRRLLRVRDVVCNRDYYLTTEGWTPDEVDNTLAYNTVAEYNKALARAKMDVLNGLFSNNVLLDGLDVTQEVIDGNVKLVRWPPSCELHHVQLAA